MDKAEFIRRLKLPLDVRRGHQLDKEMAAGTRTGCYNYDELEDYQAYLAHQRGANKAINKHITCQGNSNASKHRL